MDEREQTAEAAAGDAPATDAARVPGWRRWLREHFATPEAVYGLILYSVLIAGISDEHTDTLEVLLTSAFSLIIFFIAHAFAHALSAHGDQGFRRSAVHGIRSSSGMLYAAIPPTVPLIVGLTGALSTDDAVNLALLVAMLVLGVLGYSAYARQGAIVAMRVLGALGTMAFGFVVFILNYLVH